MKSSNFQFSDPKIINLDYSSNEDFDIELFEGFALDHNIEKAISEDNRKGTVMLTLIIGGKTKDYPFYISIKNSADFKCSDSDVFLKLIDTNAPALLLSYLRPIVSLITSQAGFPSFDLPFINFTNKD